MDILALKRQLLPYSGALTEGDGVGGASGMGVGGGQVGGSTGGGGFSSGDGGRTGSVAGTGSAAAFGNDNYGMLGFGLGTAVGYATGIPGLGTIGQRVGAGITQDHNLGSSSSDGTSGQGPNSGGNGGGNPMDGNLSNILGIASGLNGIFNQPGGGSNSYQNAADPFAPYRSGLAASYNQALTQGNQTDITKMPGYSQFQSGVMDPALEASKRSSAASGMLQSGNEQIALQKTAQQGYYGFMSDYLNRLAQGSGAVNNPAQAAGMGFDQRNLDQKGTMQGIGAIGQGLSGLFGGGGGSNYSPDMTGFQSPYQAPSYTPSFSTPDTSGLGSGGYVPPDDPGVGAWFSF